MCSVLTFQIKHMPTFDVATIEGATALLLLLRAASGAGRSRARALGRVGAITPRELDARSAMGDA